MEREQRSLDTPRLREEVQHHLVARQELGEGLEDELVASFMRQIQGAIAEEVARQVRIREIETEKLWDKRKEVLAITLGCGIPLLLFAAIFAQLMGVVVVCAMLVLVNMGIISGSLRK